MQLGRNYPYIRRPDLVAISHPWFQLPHRMAIDPGLITGSDGIAYFPGTRISEVGQWTLSSNTILWQFRPDPGTPVLLRINVTWRAESNSTISAFDVQIRRLGATVTQVDDNVNPGSFNPWYQGYNLKLPVGSGSQLTLNAGNIRAATYAECTALGDVPYV